MHCAAKGLFFFVILSLVASLVAQYENEPNISADAFFQNHSHMSVFRRLESWPSIHTANNDFSILLLMCVCVFLSPVVGHDTAPR